MSVSEDLEAAFGSVRLGDGTSLHQAEAIDRLESPAQVTAARALDAEDRWQDIANAKVERFPFALSLMNPEGLRFYLPRFVRYALDHPGGESPAVDAAIYACDLGENSPQEALAQFDLMSRDQMKVLARFLVLVTQLGDESYDALVATESLAGFWYQFLAPGDA